MSVASRGILKGEVTIDSVVEYIQNNIGGAYAESIRQDEPDKLSVIQFKYTNSDLTQEDRGIIIYYGNDYAEVTQGYSKTNLICALSIGVWGHGKEIMEGIVKHFGGWYIPNESYPEVEQLEAAV